jgi:hypothetical protein
VLPWGLTGEQKSCILCFFWAAKSFLLLQAFSWIKNGEFFLGLWGAWQGSSLPLTLTLAQAQAKQPSTLLGLSAALLCKKWG